MNTQPVARTFCFACGLVALLATTTFAQVPRSENDTQITEYKYLGTESACKRCHQEPLEQDKSSDLLDRVKLREWTIWNEDDKHSKAFVVLQEKRGSRIANLMRKNVLDESTGCIQCHTSNVDATLWDSKCGSDGLETNICISEGVGCEACHGPASKWVGPHALGDWSHKTDREKAALGFRSLHGPELRALLCLSCHVGSAKENKVITHEMYAAGHPPLSGFEIESFSDKMPRHWRQSYEKPQGTPKYERTRNMLVANVVSLRLSLELAADDVAASQSSLRWPELARLECYSCHHDLRLPSWRQSRSQVGQAGHVGRPRLHLGCEPLVRAAAHAVLGKAGRQEADALLARVQTEVFAENIFGDPKAITRLHPIVRQWSMDLEAKLLTTPLTTTKVVDILEEIYQVAGQELKDYDTARQLTGAIVIICDELAKIDKERPVPRQLANRINKLRTGFNLHEDKRKRVEETLKQSLHRRAGFKPAVFARLISLLEQANREALPQELQLRLE